jgi:hypothetical protein
LLLGSFLYLPVLDSLILLSFVEEGVVLLLELCMGPPVEGELASLVEGLLASPDATYECLHITVEEIMFL